MHLIYQLLSYLFVGLLLPFWALHPKLRRGVARRLGRYPPERPWPPSKGSGPRIWLHGASAGDLIALSPVIQELRTILPDATLILSTMTNSGHAIAQGRMRPLVDAITYVPYDLPGATRRAVAAIRPDLLVLEYTEIWPNLIHAARRAGAKVALNNGRLSEAKVRQYKLLHFLIGNQLAKLDLLLMREQVEAERALALGAPIERVVVTGNTKFDNLAKLPSSDAVAALGRALGASDQPIVVAGSTHEGEEREVLRAFATMRGAVPGVRLVLAPRYNERGAKLVTLARVEGFTAAARSTAAEDPAALASADVVVLDTMGELTTAYGLATLVFVGGSFVPRGGQNILEPAGQGRPVLFGPSMMNFRDSVEVLIGRGGIQVLTPAQLGKVATELLARPDEVKRLGEMAHSAVQKARGASRKNAERLAKLVAPER